MIAQAEAGAALFDPCGRDRHRAGAEGATAPETLRQKDRKGRGHSGKQAGDRLTEEESRGRGVAMGRGQSFRSDDRGGAGIGPREARAAR